MIKDLAEVILGDKIRANLLKTLIGNPDEYFSLKKLITTKNSNLKIKKMLEKLVSDGIINKKKNPKVKETLYKADKRSKYYSFLSKLIDEALPFGTKSIQHKISKLGGMKFIVFTDKDVSDEIGVDLLLVGENAASKSNNLLLNTLLKEAEKSLSKTIEYSYISTNEFMHRKNINDRFIRNIIDNVGIVILDKINLEY